MLKSYRQHLALFLMCLAAVAQTAPCSILTVSCCSLTGSTLLYSYSILLQSHRQHVALVLRTVSCSGLTHIPCTSLTYRKCLVPQIGLIITSPTAMILTPARWPRCWPGIPPPRSYRQHLAPWGRRSAGHAGSQELAPAAGTCACTAGR